MNSKNTNYFLFKQLLIRKNVQQIIDYFFDDKLDELFNILEDFINNELVIIADVSVCIEIYNLILYIQQIKKDGKYLENINSLLKKIDEYIYKDSLTEEYATINYIALSSKKRCLPPKFVFGYNVSDIEEYEIRDYDIIYLLIKDPDKLALIDPVYVLSSISYLCTHYPSFIIEENIYNAISYYLYEVIIKQREFKLNRINRMYLNVEKSFRNIEIEKEIRR